MSGECEGCGWKAPYRILGHQLGRATGVYELDQEVPLAKGDGNGFVTLYVISLLCHGGESTRNLSDAERKAGLRIGA